MFAALDFLIGTKIEATDCFKMIAESVLNESWELKATLNTLILLDMNLGYEYFMGNFAQRIRY